MAVSKFLVYASHSKVIVQENDTIQFITLMVNNSFITDLCEGLSRTDPPSCLQSSNETDYLCEHGFSPESWNRVCSDRIYWNALNLTCSSRSTTYCVLK